MIKSTFTDSVRDVRSLLRAFHANCSGATATEYILILALIVLPIGLMSPLFLSMLKVYGTRLLAPIGLPFP